MPTAWILLCVFLLFASPCYGGNESIPIETDPSARTIFIDRDGDGIDDYLIDTDGNGLPDRRQTLRIDASDVPLSAESGIFAGEKTGLRKYFSPANSSEFSERFCRGRCLSLSRGGFGSLGEFGPGNGIGIGAVNGTSCVGGVCDQ